LVPTRRSYEKSKRLLQPSTAAFLVDDEVVSLATLRMETFESGGE
jgi:hypothetical protein